MEFRKSACDNFRNCHTSLHSIRIDCFCSSGSLYSVTSVLCVALSNAPSCTRILLNILPLILRFQSLFVIILLTDALYKKGQSRLFFLRRLRSLDICRKMLQMFYQSVVASVLFYAAVCWGGSIKHKDARRLDKLVKRAGTVIGVMLDSLEDVVERCIEKKVEVILNNTDHPLHDIFMDQRNNGGGRLLSLRCRTER